MSEPTGHSPGPTGVAVHVARHTDPVRRWGAEDPRAPLTLGRLHPAPGEGDRTPTPHPGPALKSGRRPVQSISRWPPVLQCSSVLLVVVVVVAILAAVMTPKMALVKNRPQDRVEVATEAKEEEVLKQSVLDSASPQDSSKPGDASEMDVEEPQKPQPTVTMVSPSLIVSPYLVSLSLSPTHPPFVLYRMWMRREFLSGRALFNVSWGPMPRKPPAGTKSVLVVPTLRTWAMLSVPILKRWGRLWIRYAATVLIKPD